jgi:hypothetical protein
MADGPLFDVTGAAQLKGVTILSRLPANSTDSPQYSPFFARIWRVLAWCFARFRPENG